LPSGNLNSYMLFWNGFGRRFLALTNIIYPIAIAKALPAIAWV
jgi:hypothetical protein